MNPERWPGLNVADCAELQELLRTRAVTISQVRDYTYYNFLECGLAVSVTDSGVAGGRVVSGEAAPPSGPPAPTIMEVFLYNDETVLRARFPRLAVKGFRRAEPLLLPAALKEHAITLDETIAGVVDKLGQPERKGGGSVLQSIWLAYEGRHVQLDFCDSDWKHPDNPIHYITLF
eukprot:gnl/Spiro4/11006_TR5836_c0_g1_i1.p2 gnl/Spiro4/11006_TR5836_c0_g1~~gnl/Spiro4/11006_TR5836_c0_g1_i1.p2  ORF type:complete len:188 (+),score=34.29 gnl/Spiro4/11006_TR5836_c0_g1_i1:42-566(+)